MATPTKTKGKSKKKGAVNALSVAYIWDMSGSMGSCLHGTVEGTRAYLADLHGQEQELVDEHGASVYTRFSLTAFDTTFEQWVIDEPVADVDLSRLDRYQPRGGTALYDAIANTITELDARLVGDRAGERVLVVVMTDGGENSSIEYGHPNGRQRLFDLIKAYEAKGNWTFVWLGAGPQALAEATNVGITFANVAQFSQDAFSYQNVSSSLGQVTNSRRSSGGGTSMSAFADAGLGNDYTTPGNTSDPNIGTSSDPNHWTSHVPVAGAVAAETNTVLPDPEQTREALRKAREGK